MKGNGRSNCVIELIKSFLLNILVQNYTIPCLVFLFLVLSPLAAGHRATYKMAKRETVKKAEQLVEIAMGCNDASHDPSHVSRVRDLALSLAQEEGLSSTTDSMEIVCSVPWQLLLQYSPSDNLFFFLQQPCDFFCLICGFSRFALPFLEK